MGLALYWGRGAIGIRVIFFIALWLVSSLAGAIELPCDFSALASRGTGLEAVRAGESSSKSSAQENLESFHQTIAFAQQALSTGRAQDISDRFGNIMAGLRSMQFERYLKRVTLGMPKEKAEAFIKEFRELGPSYELAAVAEQRALEWGPEYVGSVVYRVPGDVLSNGLARDFQALVKLPRSAFSSTGPRIQEMNLTTFATPQVEVRGFELPPPAGLRETTPRQRVENELGSARHFARRIWEAARTFELEKQLEQNKADVVTELTQQQKQVETQVPVRELSSTAEIEAVASEFARLDRKMADLQNASNQNAATQRGDLEGVLKSLQTHAAQSDRARATLFEFMALTDRLTDGDTHTAEAWRAPVNPFHSEVTVGLEGISTGTSNPATPLKTRMLARAHGILNAAIEAKGAIMKLPPAEKARVEKWLRQELRALETEDKQARESYVRLEQQYAQALRAGANPKALGQILPPLRAASRRLMLMNNRRVALGVWLRATKGWTPALEKTLERAAKEPGVFFDLDGLTLAQRERMEALRPLLEPQDWSRPETRFSPAREQALQEVNEILGAPGAGQALLKARERYALSEYKRLVTEFHFADNNGVEGARAVAARAPGVLAAASRLLNHRGIRHQNTGTAIELVRQTDLGTEPSRWQQGVDRLVSGGMTLTLDPFKLQGGTMAAYNTPNNKLFLPFSELSSTDRFTQYTLHELEHFHSLRRGVGRDPDHQRHLLRIDFDRSSAQTGNLSPIQSHLYGEHQNLGEAEASYVELVHLTARQRNPTTLWDPGKVYSAAVALEQRADASYHLAAEALTRLDTDGVSNFVIRNGKQGDLNEIQVFVRVPVNKGFATIPLTRWREGKTDLEAAQWLNRILRLTLDSSVKRFSEPHLGEIQALLEQAKIYSLQRSRQAKAIQFWLDQPTETDFQRTHQVQQVYQAVNGVGRLGPNGLSPSARLSWLTQPIVGAEP